MSMKKSKILMLFSIVLSLFILSCNNQQAENIKESDSNKAVKAETIKEPITEKMVNDAQQAWCDALVSIGKIHKEGGDYKTVATKVLSDIYNYDNGTVLFKPTLAYGDQTFRLDKKGAAAYFIGGDADFPNDKGFALKPWTKVRFDNAGVGNTGVLIEGDIAITMGNVYLTDESGKEIMVDKTFAFKRGADGKLRLILHKSALPFTPTK